MTKFKQRTQHVEAAQWRPGVEIEGVTKTGQGFAIVNTPIGNVEVHEGDWVVKRTDGVQFVLCPEEFEKEYEPTMSVQTVQVDASVDPDKFVEGLVDALKPPDLSDAEPGPQGKEGNPPRPTTEEIIEAGAQGVMEAGEVPGEAGPAPVDVASAIDDKPTE